LWVSLSLLCGLLMIIRQPQTRPAHFAEIFLPILVSHYFLLWSSSASTTDDRHATMKVTFVQPSIPQTVIWDEDKTTSASPNSFSSRAALSNRTTRDLARAAVPKLLRYYDEVFEPSRSWRAAIMSGYRRRGRHGANRLAQRREDRIFQQSFLIILRPTD